MQRLWIGIALLIILLGLGLWTAIAMDKIHQPIAALLNQAAEAALQEDWQDAAALALDAKGEWERHWSAIASVADHTPMDEIDGLFAQLPIFAREEEKSDFAAVCAQLARLTQAMGNAHSLNWWNLL